MTRLLALLFLLSLPLAATAREMDEMNTVVIRTIDKISARTHTFEIPVEKTVKFGSSLFIKARACRKASPFDKPENAAFLQIWERKQDDPKSHWIFSGWMFASDPAISAMDHPVYDVWVIDCKGATTAKAEEFSEEAAPEKKPEEEAPSTDEDEEEDEEEEDTPED